MRFIKFSHQFKFLRQLSVMDSCFFTPYSAFQIVRYRYLLYPILKVLYFKKKKSNYIHIYTALIPH